MHYRDFSVRIEPDGQDGYRAHVLASPAGEGFEPFVPPWSRAEIPTIRMELGRAVARAGTEVTPQRHLEIVEDDLGHATVVRQLGSELYRALFTGSVGRLYEESRGLVARDREGLRLKLHFGPDSTWLHELPWEYLCRPGPGPGSYLGLDAQTPVVRYLEVERRPERPPFRPPLRVLALTANPQFTEPLDLDRELRKLQSVCDRSLVEIFVLTGATVQAVRRELRARSHQVVHFMGHAVFDEETGTGSLLFETDEGLADPVSGSTMAELLHSAATPPLVVLNACETARSPDLFAGVATALVQAGVGAVVAMQFPISDAAAVTFCETLYERISARDPIDAAVAEGRLAIRLAHPGSMEWGTPVLFSRLPDGQLFGSISRWKTFLKHAWLPLLALSAALAFWVIRSGAPPPRKTDPDCPSPPGLDMVFAKIPGGTFRMGSKQGPKEQEPVHEVTIRHPFCLGVFEVTQRQWQKVMGSNPSKRKGKDLPVERVSWEDAQVFLRKLNERDPLGRYRLPTEAEWEYAARGGGEALYGFGDEPEDLHLYGNCNSTQNDGHERTARVGSYRPTTRWKLYDLHGNVWEWVQDRFGEYPPGPQIDPPGPLTGDRRVRRGGSWEITAGNCSAVHRADSKRDYRSNDLGFRVVRAPLSVEGAPGQADR